MTSATPRKPAAQKRAAASRTRRAAGSGLEPFFRWLEKRVPAFTAALDAALAAGPGGRDLRPEAKRLAELLLPPQRGSLAVRLERASARFAPACRELAESQIDFEALLGAAGVLRDQACAAIRKGFALREAEGLLARLDALSLEWLRALAREFVSRRDQIIREKNAESSVLFHTSQSISTEPDLSSLLYKVVFHAGMLLHASQVYIFLTEPPGFDGKPTQRLQLQAWNQSDMTYGEYSLKFGESPIGKAALSQQTILINDYQKSEKKIPFLAGISRLLAAPILYADELLGVLVIADTARRERFVPADKELLNMYATQIAVTLKNMLLFQNQATFLHELEEKNRMLEAQADVILRKSAQLVVMNEVSQQVNSSLDLPEVLLLLARHAAESIGVDRCIVWLMDEKKIRLEAAAAYGFPADQVPHLSLFLPDIRETNFFQVLADQKPAEVSSGQDAAMFRQQLQGLLEIRNMLVVPLVLKNESIGILAVDDMRETHNYLEDEASLVCSLANQAVLAIENARLYQQVKEQAITDGLTGLYNHRYFQLRFSEEFAHCRRYGNDLAVIMLDIDHFKHYNDTYGHIAGDLALKEIANLTRASVRENDLVARYGGEEFVIILPQTPLDGAKIVCERIRESVENCKFLGDLHAPQVSITVSLGVSAFDKQRHTVREVLLKEADTALYTAKETGRNQVILYQPPAEAAEPAS